MNTATTTNGYSGIVGTATPLSGNINTIVSSGTGVTISGNSSYSISNQIQNNMTPKQVHVAVFTITRDKDTNEINSTSFNKELWVEQKNGASIELLVAKQLDRDFDPEFTVIKVLSTVSF